MDWTATIPLTSDELDWNRHLQQIKDENERHFKYSMKFVLVSLLIFPIVYYLSLAYFRAELDIVWSLGWAIWVQAFPLRKTWYMIIVAFVASFIILFAWKTAGYLLYD